CAVVGDDFDADSGNRRGAAPVFRIGFKVNRAAFAVRDEPVRSRTYRRGGLFGAGARGNDADGGQIAHERIKRFTGAKDDGKGVGRFDARDLVDGAANGGTGCRSHNRVEGVLDVGGCQETAIVKACTLAQVKGEGATVRRFGEVLREGGNELEVLILDDEC